MTIPYVDAAALAQALPMAAAIEALRAALLGGLDPGSDPPRTAVPAGAGQLLLMPSVESGHIGVKLLSVAPDNPTRGLPRVQGVFVLFDPDTLAPVALIDGRALTSLRTPAVSALAVDYLATADAARLVVFGSGPQADGHILAVTGIRPITEVVIVGRDPAGVEALAGRYRSAGVAARAGGPHDVEGADIIVCATSAREPLFDGRLVSDHTCVVAIGSHEPTAREVDASLVARSFIVVEHVATALREAGDVIGAGVSPDDLHPLADLVNGRVPVQAGRPALVKTVGMAWQDAVVAAAAIRRKHG